MSRSVFQKLDLFCPLAQIFAATTRTLGFQTSQIILKKNFTKVWVKKIADLEKKLLKRRCSNPGGHEAGHAADLRVQLGRPEQAGPSSEGGEDDADATAGL